MTRRQMMIIARRAARLAVSVTGQWTDEQFGYYKEYLDQLKIGDDDCLKGWLGSQIEDGVREAVEVRKMWLKACLAA